MLEQHLELLEVVQVLVKYAGWDFPPQLLTLILKSKQFKRLRDLLH